MLVLLSLQSGMAKITDAWSNLLELGLVCHFSWLIDLQLVQTNQYRISAGNKRQTMLSIHFKSSGLVAALMEHYTM